MKANFAERVIQTLKNLYGDICMQKKIIDTSMYCKAQPHCASLGYPFHNTAAHMKATPTREGI